MLRVSCSLYPFLMLGFSSEPHIYLLENVTMLNSKVVYIDMDDGCVIINQPILSIKVKP